MSKYDSIMNMYDYSPKFHPRMSIYNRASQFAPYAALTGYEDQVIETARLTDKEKEITEDMKILLDMKLKIIEKNIKNKPIITVLYFEPDKRKSGGKYAEYNGQIKKVDYIYQQLIFQDRFKIDINHILDIKLKEEKL